jgi:hypothetical protein
MLSQQEFVTKKTAIPWLAVFVVVAVAVFQLHNQGRLWICACGAVYLWSGNIWSSDNSQHIFDPYSFTHILHGVVFCWILTWLFPRMALMWRFFMAIVVESLWEVVENTEFVIQRYRETTASLDYFGDTIINSVADIALCGLGFLLAYYVGFKRSLVLFVATELILLFWIRDSLILNVIMLVYPIEAIKQWQVGL